MMTCYMYFQKLFLTNTQEYVLFVQFIVGMFCFTKLSKDKKLKGLKKNLKSMNSLYNTRPITKIKCVFTKDKKNCYSINVSVRLLINVEK